MITAGRDLTNSVLLFDCCFAALTRLVTELYGGGGADTDSETRTHTHTQQ